MNWSCATRQLGARVDPATLAAQPLTVEQARARELGAEPSALETLNRMAVERVRVAWVGHGRASARLDAENPVGAAGARHLGQPPERVGGRLRPTAARRCLDELAERPAGHGQVGRIRGSELRGGERLVIAAEAVVKNGSRPVEQAHPRAVAARDSIPSRGLVQLRNVSLATAVRGERDPRAGGAVAADRLMDCVLLHGERRCGREIAGEQLPADPHGGRHRQQ